LDKSIKEWPEKAWMYSLSSAIAMPTALHGLNFTYFLRLKATAARSMTLYAPRLTQHIDVAQSIVLYQAPEDRLYGTLAELFHAFAPPAVLPGICPLVLPVIGGAGDLPAPGPGTAGSLLGQLSSSSSACRPANGQSHEGKQSAHWADVAVSFLNIGKARYLRLVHPKCRYSACDALLL
jgi:hypothetical protein